MEQEKSLAEVEQVIQQVKKRQSSKLNINLESGEALHSFASEHTLARTKLPPSTRGSLPASTASKEGIKVLKTRNLHEKSAT